MAQVLTYKYRLLPTRRQHGALRAILESQRELYNAALEERIACYRKTGRSLSYIDQCKSLTHCRRELPEMAALPANIQRGTLKRLEEAFKGFFRRLKRGGKPGFPRFRGTHWFTSFAFNEFSGIGLDDRRLRFAGMPGGVRVHLHRPMPDGKILTAKFKRDAKGWSVCLAVRVDTPDKRPIACAAGIDVGITTLAAASDEQKIPNPRAARRAEREMRRRQRQLARCRRGSKRRSKIKARVARLHAKITNTRATALHQAGAELVKRYDMIAVEALNIKGLAKGMLARDVHDAGWSKLRSLLHYKAERAGVHIIEVDARFTSQECPDCGRREPKTLAERVHRCPCGCVLDRDVAAARVILNRAVVGPGWLKVGDCAVPATGNITELSK